MSEETWRIVYGVSRMTTDPRRQHRAFRVPRYFGLILQDNPAPVSRRSQREHRP